MPRVGGTIVGVRAVCNLRVYPAVMVGFCVICVTIGYNMNYATLSAYRL